MVSPLYFWLGCLAVPPIKLLYRIRGQGLENLPQGGFVLAANHTSNFDPWPLGIPLWPRRQLYFMAKVELFNPILAPILRGLGAFPVRRGEADVEAMRTAVELVRAGKIVVMFPEGTRQRKGMRKKFQPRAHSGAARIALGAKAPLVPAAISGTDRLSRLARLEVAYGPPVPTNDLGGLDPKEAAGVATERLMETIAGLKAGL